MSNLLQIIKDNSKYTDEEAQDLENQIAKVQEENISKAIKQLARNQNLVNYVGVPTNLKEGELDQTTEVHPKLKGYDHSLEQVRIKFQQPVSDPNKPMEVNDARPPDENMGEFGIDWESLASKLT